MPPSSPAKPIPGPVTGPLASPVRSLEATVLASPQPAEHRISPKAFSALEASNSQSEYVTAEEDSSQSSASTASTPGKAGQAANSKNRKGRKRRH